MVRIVHLSQTVGRRHRTLCPCLDFFAATMAPAVSHNETVLWTGESERGGSGKIRGEFKNGMPRHRALPFRKERERVGHPLAA